MMMMMLIMMAMMISVTRLRGQTFLPLFGIFPIHFLKFFLLSSRFTFQVHINFQFGGKNLMICYHSRRMRHLQYLAFFNILIHMTLLHSLYRLWKSGRRCDNDPRVKKDIIKILLKRVKESFQEWLPRTDH